MDYSTVNIGWEPNRHGDLVKQRDIFFCKVAYSGHCYIKSMASRVQLKKEYLVVILKGLDAKTN
jgi:hypothetical protein